VPVAKLSLSAVESLHSLGQQARTGTLVVPPPPEGVSRWPVVGKQLATSWGQASENLEEFLSQHREEVRPVVGWVVGQAASLWSGTLVILLAILIAGLLLARADAAVGAAVTLAERLAGEGGASIVATAGATIRSVAQGVLGIAVIQSLLAGVGMLVVGVPAAGLWAGMVLIVAIVQLPPILVLGPVIVYVFMSSSTAVAVVFAVYAVLVGFSDTLLKPLFLGRGMEIPMPVILIGAIGGMITSGIVGLFIGAMVLALGYELGVAWVGRAVPPETADASEGTPRGSG